MSLRKLPEVKALDKPKGLQWDAPSDVLSRWANGPMAAEGSGDNVITVFDVIGEDYWSGGGFTAKRTAAALRSIGERDVVVQVNSPGGDLFEGLAIYNLLRAHKGKVTVNVMGYAASAASIIAMAGDEIVMGLGTFMMVHNAWGMVIGNRHDLADAAKLFEGFDSAMTDIYEARTTSSRKDIVKLLNAETWLSPTDAVAAGFADRIDSDLKAMASGAVSDNPVKARRQVEAALAKAGISRSQRQDLLSEIMGAKRDATPDAKRDAGVPDAAIRQLIETFKV
ncbi:head maturation protease, ClpP-related [Rhizobium sp. SGZ-381]|uniref:head maturation protease, ClpP-related n=1 Tax=Rhizobium sp. SGZ-381 TaxID=3342800 RepID=UPI003670436C